MPIMRDEHKTKAQLIDELRALRQRVADQERDANRSPNGIRHTYAALNSLTGHIAVLDQDGKIVAVNEAWKHFARNNGDPPVSRIGIGANYLAVCRQAAAGDPEVESVLSGVQAVLDNRQDTFSCEYACHAPDEQRWFEMHVTRLGDGPGVVIAHENITRRRQLEDSLRLSEERYRQVFDAAQDGIWMTDPEGNTTLVNGRLAQILGCSIDELMTRPVHDFMFEEDSPEKVQQTMARRRRGVVEQYEIQLRRKDGSAVWVIVSATPILDASNRFSAALAMITDISARKQAEERLRESEERFQVALRSSPVVVFTKDRGLRYTWINNIRVLLPPGVEDAIGLRDRDLMERLEEAERIEVLDRRVLETGMGLREEVRIHFGGVPRVFVLSSEPLRDTAGQIVGITCAAADITEQKQGEAELRANETRLRMLLEQRQQELEILWQASQRLTGPIAVQDLLEMTTRALVETLPNAEATSLWLYDEPSDQLVVRAWTGHDDAVISERTWPPDRGVVGQVYCGGQPKNIGDVAQEPAFEWLGHPKLDAARSLVGVPLRASGETLGALFAVSYTSTHAFRDRDVSLMEVLATKIAITLQNVRLFEQILAARAKMRELAQGVISAQEEDRRRISYELHDGASQALALLKLDLHRLRSGLTGEVSELQYMMDRSIDLVDHTMSQIRTLAYNLHPPMLDSRDLGDVLAGYCQDLAERTGLAIDFTSSALSIYSDPIGICLYRFVQEATTNALKHAEATAIRVYLGQKANEIVLTVEDDGIGFDPHAALVADRKPRHLGLLGIRERVAFLGGHLEIAARPGQGSRLTARIPLEHGA